MPKDNFKIGKIYVITFYDHHDDGLDDEMRMHEVIGRVIKQDPLYVAVANWIPQGDLSKDVYEENVESLGIFKPAIISKKLLS